MLRFLVIAGFVLALLPQLTPDSAAWAGGGNLAAGADVVVAAADNGLVTAVPCGGHFPGLDSTHRHVSCACSALFAMPSSMSAAPGIADTVVRFVLVDDSLMGRTLLPPVPPPLA